MQSALPAIFVHSHNQRPHNFSGIRKNPNDFFDFSYYYINKEYISLQTEEEMKKLEADVAVVAVGLSGLAAAVAAAFSLQFAEPDFGDDV